MENDIKLIRFGLRKITTEQFAIIESNFVETISSDINMSTGLKFGVNAEKHMISVTVSVNFSQNEKHFIILEITCFFEILADDWLLIYNSDLNYVELEIGFARHVVMFTIGTIRGVLHSKTEGTNYNKFFIPTINVHDLIKENVCIDLPK